MFDTSEAQTKLEKFLESLGIITEKSKNYLLRDLIDKCKDKLNFSSLLKELIIEDFLPLNDLLYATNVLLYLGETLSPRAFLSIFNNSLSVKLKSEGKKELLLQNNEVLIGEIVGVFTSLTLSEKTQGETVSSLLGNFKWYRDYLDPLGIIKD